MITRNTCCLVDRRLFSLQPLSAGESMGLTVNATVGQTFQPCACIRTSPIHLWLSQANKAHWSRVALQVIIILSRCFLVCFAIAYNDHPAARISGMGPA